MCVIWNEVLNTQLWSFLDSAHPVAGECCLFYLIVKVEGSLILRMQIFPTSATIHNSLVK